MNRFKSIAALVFFTACASQQKNLATQTAATATADASITIQGKLYATLFQQRAAEYDALCFQAYNIARLRVDQWQKSTAKPTAIVTDIDETVLDNSPYDAHQALQNKDYDQKAWEQWTAMSKADTVPGALSFLKHAASKGLEIFYITNRNETERAGTLRNLQQFGFPNADNAHLVLRQTTSSKEARRQEVLKTHDILLLLGDNLADFSVLYDRKTVEERMLTTRQIAAEFGRRFIVLPNPVYGDWESSLFSYRYNFTAAQKDSIIKSSLKSY